MAQAAGLERPEAYRALVSISDDYQQAQGDLNRLLSFRSGTAEQAQWCNIGPTQRPDCSVTGPIFASGADFERGPLASLFTDEKGVGKNVRNCIGWKLREPAGSIDADSGLQYLAGIGHMLKTEEAGRSYAWVGDTIQLCDDRIALPLLCVQQPPTP